MAKTPYILPKEFTPGYSTTKKPTIPVEIDWSHPFTEGLYDVYMFDNRGGLKSLNYNHDIKLNSSGVEVDHEKITTNTDNTEYISIPALPVSDWTEATFIFKTSNVTGASGGGGRYLGVLYAGGDDIRVYRNAMNSFIASWDDGSILNHTVSITEADENTIAISHNGSTQKTYLNGELKNSGANTYNFSGTDGETQIGSSPANLSVNYASYHYLFVFKKAISDSVIASLYKNPNQILKPAIDTVYFTADAGGGTTVTGTLETLTLTEYAATITTDTVTTVTGTLETLTLTEYPATITALVRTSVTGTLETLTLTEYQATINLGKTVTGTLETLTLTEYPATINAVKNITGTLETLTLTEYPATVTEGTSTSITGTLETLTLTEYPGVITYTQAIYATLETLTLTTFKADITYVGGEEESYSGGWDYPSRPTKEEEKADRIKQGIIEPDKPKKKVKLISKVSEVKTDFTQVKTLEQARQEQQYLKQLQQRHEQVKRRGIEKKVKEAADKAIIQRISLALGELEQQKQLIEEQDIVFVMMMLAA